MTANEWLNVIGALVLLIFPAAFVEIAIWLRGESPATPPHGGPDG